MSLRAAREATVISDSAAPMWRRQISPATPQSGMILSPSGVDVCMCVSPDRSRSVLACPRGCDRDRHASFSISGLRPARCQLAPAARNSPPAVADRQQRGLQHPAEARSAWENRTPTNFDAISSTRPKGDVIRLNASVAISTPYVHRVDIAGLAQHVDQRHRREADVGGADDDAGHQRPGDRYAE